MSPALLSCLRCLLVCLALAACAGGGNCQVEKWAELPVRLYRNVPLVPANINHMPAILVLDTGAQRTLITKSAAERLGIGQGQKAAIMRGIGGATVNWETKPDSFSFAAIGVDAMSVMVAPISLPSIQGVQPDGLLGADVLAALDVELDLPHRRVAFYKPRTCPAGPPWTETYATIAARRNARNALIVPVSLDGVPLQAELDSGTSVSTVTLPVALKTGLGSSAFAGDPMVQVRGANLGTSQQPVHRFRELGIGDDVFPDPQLLVGGQHPADWEMLLGSDYLRSKRVWLSYATSRVFVSPRVGAWAPGPR